MPDKAASEYPISVSADNDASSRYCFCCPQTDHNAAAQYDLCFHNLVVIQLFFFSALRQSFRTQTVFTMFLFKTGQTFPVKYAILYEGNCFIDRISLTFHTIV